MINGRFKTWGYSHDITRHSEVFWAVAIITQLAIENGSPLFKVDYEEENGQPLQEKFSVSKKEAEKAGNRLKSRLKLDVGVELKFSSGFIHQAANFMERGHDDERRMEFVKIWFHKEEPL
jgi:hypothetical protein